MEYTEEQKAEFKASFNEKKKRQRMLIVLIVVLMIPAFGMRLLSDSAAGQYAPIFAMAFGLSVLAGLVFSMKNWRCPACGKYLGQDGNPRYCSKCGITLQ